MQKNFCGLAGEGNASSYYLYCMQPEVCTQFGSSETSCNDARRFDTAATDRRRVDALAECHLRVEGTEGRVCRVAVRRVASNRPFALARLARCPCTAERCNAVHARSRRRRGSRAGRGGSAWLGLPPRGTRRAQRARWWPRPTTDGSRDGPTHEAVFPIAHWSEQSQDSLPTRLSFL